MEKKDEYVVGVLSKGRCFGEMNAFLEQPSVYTFVAYDRVLLLRVVRDSLEEFVKNNPKNVIDIIKNLSHHMSMQQKNIELFLEEKDYELQQEELEKQKEELKNKIRFYNIYGLQGYVSGNFEKNKK